MPERRRPSLAGRALLALGLMAAFYGLALAVSTALVLVPYLEYKLIRRVHPKLAIGCVAGAGAILWSILPRRDRFEPPGPLLEPGGHSRLFDEIRRVSEAAGQEMPAEVYLEPDVNAWVGQRGGLMGFGGRRVMGVGLPLLQILTASQLRSVLAHEFGHYHGGDTRLGPWVYKTRAAIFRTLENLRDKEGKSSILSLPFVGFAKLFFRVSSAVSRNQEFAADELSARLFGSRPAREALLRIHRASVAFEPYMNTEVLPVLRAGFRPPVAEGFSRFLGARNIAGATEEILRKEMQHPTHDPYQTHPPLAERLSSIETLPAGEAPAEDPPAVGLLSDLPRLETELLVRGTGAAEIRGFPALSWDEVGERAYVPMWKKACAEGREALAGLTPASLPDCLPRLAELGASLAGREIDRAEAQGRAAGVLGAALALSLRREGWALEALPGLPILLRRGEESVEPFDVLPSLAKGLLAAGAWKERCAALGIAGLDLARAGD